MLLSSLIRRIDLSALDVVLGKNVAAIVQDRNKDLQPSKIKELMLGGSNLSYLIEDKEKMICLLSFLSEDEKTLMSSMLGCPVTDLTSEVRKSYDDRRLEKIYKFFEQPHVKVESKDLPRVEGIIPKRGLRDYQAALLAKFKKEFSRDSMSKVLLHLPTGSGKTRIAMRFLCEELASSNKSFLWIANDNRLLRQAEDEFSKTWEAIGDSPANIVRLDRSTTDEELAIPKSAYFCTVQSYFEMFKREDPLYKKIAKSAKIVVFDEAHKIVAATYETAVRTICYYSEAFLIGLSATPGRSTLNVSEDVKLTEFFGNNKIKLSTTDFGFENPFNFLIENKYLAKPIFARLQYDLGQVSKLHFVYNKLIELSERYKKILVFCEGIDEADDLGAALRLTIPNSFTVHSKNSDSLNHSAIEHLRNSGNSNPTIVLNAEMLTTGFDAPGIDCLVVAKSCNSVISFSQMVGRGLRGPASGGSDEVMIFHIQDQSQTFYFELDQMFNFWEGVWDE